MLINHRRSAYVDTEALELASGMLKQRCAEGTLENDKYWYYRGARAALKSMEINDIKDAGGLVLLVDRKYDLLKGKE